MLYTAELLYSIIWQSRNPEG